MRLLLDFTSFSGTSPAPEGELMMSKDPIVEETRKLRQEMMDEAGTTLDDLFAYLQKEQETYRDRVVRLPPRKAIPLALRD
jgi:hypothetical protein